MTKDRAREGIGEKAHEEPWASIDWINVEHRVKNLRQRIYRATENGDWNKVRSLTKLMLRSRSNLLVSVRRVTQTNSGRDTPGVDGKLALTPKARWKLVERMSTNTMWKAQPARRVYIPKRDGKQRPLGIPTIENRVAQAVVKNALEPSWEARFEKHSYGFRPGRSCHDAISQCWIRLNRSGKHKWVLDADIQGAFDNISHAFVLTRIAQTPGRELIKRWLKAGYMDQLVLHDTTSGTPQGGVVSPLLANIALDGMEQLLGSKLGFIRYADDFIITARTREELEAVIPAVREWLQQRGLALHPQKTKLIRVAEGFDFLGFNVRQYSGKCLIKPQKEKVLAFLRHLRLWLKANPQATVEAVIRYFNPRLTGWGNYYRHVVSKQVFGYIDNQIWRMLWRWCLRRHPNKGQRWIKHRYFKRCNGSDWNLYATCLNRDKEPYDISLRKLSAMKITRHIKIKADASPDNPSLKEYWESRQISERQDPWFEHTSMDA